jgi:hypothetical protein
VQGSRALVPANDLQEVHKDRDMLRMDVVVSDFHKKVVLLLAACISSRDW